MQEVLSMREDTPYPTLHPPPQSPDADPHNSTSLQPWLQGRRKCERKNKRYFFDLMKGAGPRHLKGLSGHHTTSIQGHYTLTRPPPPPLHLMPGNREPEKLPWISALLRQLHGSNKNRDSVNNPIYTIFKVLFWQQKMESNLSGV